MVKEKKNPPRSKIRQIGFRVLRVVLAVYIGLVAFYTVFQRSLIYVPTKAEWKSEAAMASGLKLKPWPGKGEAFQGWRTGDATAPVRVLVMHGNAGSALHRNYYAEAFQALQPPWEVVILEYPGYGARGGSPSQKSLVAAGMQAVKTLQSEDARPLILLGESIGSGVAAQVASRLPADIAGLWLVTPFDRLERVARKHFPYLPAGLLLMDRYESDEALVGFSKPVLMMIAGDDEVVGAEAGERLFQSVTAPKKRMGQDAAGHNNWDISPRSAWWAEARDFFTDQWGGQ